MKSEPLVSIGISFFNPGDKIFDAIKSVFAQTYSNWELILVNDGSTDGVNEIIRNINDPRVVLIDDGENLGLVDRLNQITKCAKGKYISRMDADDLMYPDRIYEQVKYLEQHPNVNFVDTGVVVIDGQKNIVGERNLNNYVLPKIEDVLKRGVVVHPTILGRSAWFRNNLYNKKYLRAEDRDLLLRTLKVGEFFHINKPLYFYFFEGNVRMRPFLRSYSSERKLLVKYGPKNIGFFKSFVFYIRSIMKSFMLIVLILLKKDKIVTRNSYVFISSDNQSEAKENLDKISKIQVPGLHI